MELQAYMKEEEEVEKSVRDQMTVHRDNGSMMVEMTMESHHTQEEGQEMARLLHHKLFTTKMSPMAVGAAYRILHPSLLADQPEPLLFDVLHRNKTQIQQAPG